MSSDLELINQIYSNLSPRGFEIFIKDLLEKIGFDDIEITGRSGDSGIDLAATLRKSEIPGIETNVSYVVQAKRYKPKITLNPRFIRELRGAIQSGQRGILITTSRVSRKSVEEEALKDISRIILVIDGEKLVELCKNLEMGIQKRYQIDEDYFSKLEVTEPELEEEFIANKLITENDIRARILRIPREVKNILSENQRKLKIYLEDGSSEIFNIDSTNEFLSGVTSTYKKFGLIDADKKFHPQISDWKKKNDGYLISFSEYKKEERANVSLILENIFKIKFNRKPGTSLFVGGGKKLLCRYSRYYDRDINYWYGITPKDIGLLKKESVNRLAFVCGNKKVVLIDTKMFFDKLKNLNVTRHENDEIRHYHIHFKEENDKIIWLLKGRDRIELGDIYPIQKNIT